MTIITIVTIYVCKSLIYIKITKLSYSELIVFYWYTYITSWLFSKAYKVQSTSNSVFFHSFINRSTYEKKVESTIFSLIIGGTFYY